MIVRRIRKNTGFTLIELMIVMSIVAVLMGMVGPLAINSLEKAQAKQEMLSLKNWLRKISARAFYTGQSHVVEFKGKQVLLFSEKIAEPIESTVFNSLFFQPQQLHYNQKGFVNEKQIVGTFRQNPLTIELSVWVNGESELDDSY